MNLFFRELKTNRKALFFWCLGMIALIGSSIAKFAAYSGNGQSLSEVLKVFPKSMQVLFGLTGFDLNTASGYMGITFMYIAIMAAIHAVLLGSGIISKEERDRTSEFLLVKPMSRYSIVTYKISAAVLNVITLNVVTALSSIYFIKYLAKDDSAIGYIMLLMTGLFILQLLFLFVGSTFAAVLKKSKLSGSVSTSVMLFTFILTFFINLNNNLDPLKYLTPFKYFDARDLLANGHLDVVYVSISFVLLFIMTIATYRFYDNRDLTV